MTSLPTMQKIKETLIAAGKAHHEFQTNFLDGVRHEQWAMWYSAYILGRLGDFTTATLLTRWLEEVTDKDSWFKKTAEYIFKKINEN